MALNGDFKTISIVLRIRHIYPPFKPFLLLQLLDITCINEFESSSNMNSKIFLRGPFFLFLRAAGLPFQNLSFPEQQRLVFFTICDNNIDKTYNNQHWNNC